MHAFARAHGANWIKINRRTGVMNWNHNFGALRNRGFKRIGRRKQRVAVGINKNISPAQQLNHVWS